MDESSNTTTDWRTGLVELSLEECWQLLTTTGAGRVAVSDGSTPDIFPVNYEVFGGEIVIRTEGGTKLAAATMMHTVAFEIDEIDPRNRTGWSVVVKGRAREPITTEELVALDDLGMQPWVSTPKTRWLIITPTSITGRRLPD